MKTNTTEKSSQTDARQDQELSTQNGHAALVGLVTERIRITCRLRLVWWAYQEENQDDVGQALNEDDWKEQTPEISVLVKSLAETEDAIKAEPASRISRLISTFPIYGQGESLLHLCIAQAVDPTLGAIYATLQGAPLYAYVTDNLVDVLFDTCEDSASSTALFDWRVIWRRDVGAGRMKAMEMDPAIMHWLAGGDILSGPFRERLIKVNALRPLADWPVDETVDLSQSAIYGHIGASVLIRIIGPDASGRRSFAAAVAKRLNFKLIAVDLQEVSREEWPELHLIVQRAAFLEHAAIAWMSANGLCQPAGLPGFPLQFELSNDDTDLLRANCVVEHRVHLSVVSIPERERLWSLYLPQDVEWRDDDIASLAKAKAVYVGEIVAASAQSVRNTDDVLDALKKIARGKLDPGVSLLDSQFTWEDLILHERVEQAIRDLAYEAEERKNLWAEEKFRRHFPQGRGLVAMFNGPPGTGKTMAAQVLANTLKLDLYVIDPAMVVSKYVGETTQNIRRVLQSAKDDASLLFFDEADQFFVKRTDVRTSLDKHSNADTNYLLQAIENYPGIAVLATNKRTNIDVAFTRRFRYIIDFQRPDAHLRLRLWQIFVAALGGDETKADDKILRHLSEQMDFNGAQIKGAVLTAVFAARQENKPVGKRHLVSGIDRELMKEGRALSMRDKEALLSHGH